MPKQVDHAQRRNEIAEATWRLIAERGIEAAKMREISTAIGMANGALKHYFRGGKNSIIMTAFEHVFQATNARIQGKLGSASGLPALRIFCQEILPLDETTRLEARVVIPFWQRALGDDELARVHADAATAWGRQIAEFLRAGRADGSVRTPIPDEAIIDQLLAMLVGGQVMALLSPDSATPERQQRMIDAFLAALMASTSPAHSGES